MASIMKEHVFFYAYLFMGRIRKSTQFDFLGNKKLPSQVMKFLFFLKSAIYTEMKYARRHYQTFESHY
jgi:hypothetical protein